METLTDCGKVPPGRDSAKFKLMRLLYFFFFFKDFVSLSSFSDFNKCAASSEFLSKYVEAASIWSSCVHKRLINACVDIN